MKVELLSNEGESSTLRIITQNESKVGKIYKKERRKPMIT